MWRKRRDGAERRQKHQQKHRESFFLHVVPKTSPNADETSLWYVAQRCNIVTTHARSPMLSTVGMLENIKRMKTQSGFLCGTISLILEVEYVKRALPMPHTKTGVKCWRRKVLKRLMKNYCSVLMGVGCYRTKSHKREEKVVTLPRQK
jgi:hypothetical protein